MSAGKRDKRITIQSPSASQDAAGQMVNTWATVATVWASIKHQSGASAIKSDGDTSSVKASIRILRLAGVNAGMRVVHGSTVYAIEAVLPDEKNIHMDLIGVSVNVES